MVTPASIHSATSAAQLHLARRNAERGRREKMWKQSRTIEQRATVITRGENPTKKGTL